MKTETKIKIKFDSQLLTIEDVVALAEKRATSTLSTDREFVERIRCGSEFLERLLAEDGVIYGVTTGYGDSCTVEVPAKLVGELPRHLYTFHGCGMGREFGPAEVRAILVARMASLSRGYSGVRYELLQQLALLLEHDILPVMPEEGSVGASGDLTPLSYLAAVLAGERVVIYQGKRSPTAEVFAELGIEPLAFRPKEALAIMNGTAVMTALSCLAYRRAAYLSQLASRITSMASVALAGNRYHFDDILFSVKPHAGQAKVAERIRQDLHVGDAPRHSSRLQDRYSLRCAPHVIGVLEDSLPWFRQYIETELNSANDNPIIDGEGEHVLHGGHFYGGHIAFAMDSMKNAVANIADLLDRQLAQLVDVRFNHGLPANLSGADDDRAMLNHGFKAVQIGASAWTAEALKLTMPASVFSRSTECHNQDKVSMGTIAARDCLRILELTEQVAVAVLFATVQGVELRLRRGDISAQELPAELSETLDQVRNICPFVKEDRALEHDLRRGVEQTQNRGWSLYDEP